MATRIVVLNKGRVEQWGTPISFTTIRSTRSSPRMNLIPGGIVGDASAN